MADIALELHDQCAVVLTQGDKLLLLQIKINSGRAPVRSAVEYYEFFLANSDRLVAARDAALSEGKSLQDFLDPQSRNL